ncbi:MAG: colanic acid biosynthesis glycosyltransferase WcaL [Elainellaceae cyanobacterium]
MRVAFLVGKFPNLSETFILNQIIGLIKQGHEVDIFADEPADISKVHPDVDAYNLIQRTHYFGMPNDQRASQLNGIKLSLLNFSRHPNLVLQSWNKAKHDPGNLFLRSMLPHMIVPFLSRPPYDIIHCHFGQNGLRGLMLKQVGAVKGKLVTTFYGYDISQYIQQYGKEVYQQFFAEADLFCAISEHMKHQLIELGCDPNKIAIQRLGIDCEKFTFVPRSLGSNQRVQLLSICRLVEKKGAEYAIRAIAQVAKDYPTLEYKIIGDGPLRQDLECLIQELGVGTTVQLLGWKQQEEVVQLLKQAHILLAPSVTSKSGDQEGTPVAIMEAMAMGLPVISTQHSGIPEMIQDGVSGLLAPERNVEQLAEKIRYVVEHPETWNQFGEAGRKAVEESYNIEKLNSQLIKLYQNLIFQS